jgi:hypothetical protein
MTIYRAVPDVIEGARVEVKHLSLNGDLWRDRLAEYVTELGWHFLAELAQEDAEAMRANPIDKRKARV